MAEFSNNVPLIEHTFRHWNFEAEIDMLLVLLAFIVLCVSHDA